jgi:YYY domain-containing protein
MEQINDWIGREGGSLLVWWLITLGASVAVYPLVFRLARGLPSRGLTLARTAGILLIGYVFWILNIFGALRNTGGSAILVALVIFSVGIISYLTWREREPILPFLRKHIPLILTTEAIFLIAFFAWGIIRGLNPEFASTEKPMEIAFLSAARRSEVFPPVDPWMSGYAISYYHFGYILISVFANLSGVTNGLAFGIASPFLFAMTAVSVFGVIWDLIATRVEKINAIPYAMGVIGIVVVLLMGNLGSALIEAPYQTRSLPEFYFQFMDFKGRDYSGQTDCAPTGVFPPTCGWWWFNLTRVVRDRNLNGAPEEIINEFPIFSFVLSDIHPHVLSLPFVILAIHLLLNMVLTRRGAHPWEFLIYVICIGGLIFLNTWDGVFLGLLIGAEALRRLLKNGTGYLTRDDYAGLAAFTGLVLFTTGILYLPFFISFRSQAGGIIPNLIYPTRFQHFIIALGTFAFITLCFVITELRRAKHAFNHGLSSQVLIYGSVGGLVLLIAAAILSWAREDIRYAVYKIVDQSGGLAGIIPELIGRRLLGLILLVFLGIIIYLVVGRLFARAPRNTEETVREVITYSPTTGYVLLLIGAGAALVLIPEFVYLRDNFSTRINMIFKLWYQTWAIWGIASVYAIWSLLSEVRVPQQMYQSVLRGAFGVATAILVLLGFWYTPSAVYSRMVVDGGHSAGVNRITLDGSPSLLGYSEDDLKAVACLKSLSTNDSTNLAEAMQDVAYNSRFGRISALSGIPTLIGWPNHQRQWRGTTYDSAAGTRLTDIDLIYKATDLNEVRGLINRYGIDYIFVGQTERTTFEQTALAKFEALPKVCQFGSATVYATAPILTGVPGS